MATATLSVFLVQEVILLYLETALYKKRPPFSLLAVFFWPSSFPLFFQKFKPRHVEGLSTLHHRHGFPHELTPTVFISFISLYPQFFQTSLFSNLNQNLRSFKPIAAFFPLPTRFTGISRSFRIFFLVLLRIYNSHPFFSVLLRTRIFHRVLCPPLSRPRVPLQVRTALAGLYACYTLFFRSFGILIQQKKTHHHNSLP